MPLILLCAARRVCRAGRDPMAGGRAVMLLWLMFSIFSFSDLHSTSGRQSSLLCDRRTSTSAGMGASSARLAMLLWLASKTSSLGRNDRDDGRAVSSLLERLSFTKLWHAEKSAPPSPSSWQLATFSSRRRGDCSAGAGMAVKLLHAMSRLARHASWANAGGKSCSRFLPRKSALRAVASSTSAGTASSCFSVRSMEVSTTPDTREPPGGAGRLPDGGVGRGLEGSGPGVSCGAGSCAVTA
mmetsp:Transcript_1448/g.3412  ORF Transcript_1448/g.3412 Transcript_1448/m.3412 type:complete len:241 (-) Transcript_1448:494-1216(-)